MHTTVSPRRLSRGERLGVIVLLLGAVALGGVVEVRSVCLKRRMTDLQVYLRASWAVVAGENIYQVTDDNNWHYLYPPFLAILLVPLHSPPTEAAWTSVPYPISVALWYVLSLGFLFLAVHLLAGALEQASPDPAVRGQPAGCSRWWRLRLFAVAACLPMVGLTLVRGQVGMLVMLVFCGMTAAYLRGRRTSSGVWLAVSVCLKVIPAFLLLFALLRRDGRMLAGCAAGLLLGVVVLPAVAMGPTRAVDCYRSWAQIFLLPAIGQGQDTSCNKEILDATATHSQSPLIVIHNTMYPEFDTRPKQVAPWVKRVHLLIGGLLTVLVLLPALRRRIETGPAVTVLLGSLILVMTQVSPVCHQHYFVWSVPLVMGIQAALWERGGYTDRVGPALWLLWLLNFAPHGLPLIPGLAILRDLGLPMYGGLLLLAWGNVVLWQQPRLRPATPLAAAAPAASRAA